MLHPKEPLGKVGYHFLKLSLTLKVVLDHIAEYLRFFSDAPSFWFTLIISYNHALHLSSRCPCCQCCCCHCHRCCHPNCCQCFRMAAAAVVAGGGKPRQQCRLLPGCIVVVAVVDAPLLAPVPFLLLSPKPFLLPLLFPWPPPLHRRRFFCCCFELIVVCAPRNCCCCHCLCRHHCNHCHCCCCCCCCHHCRHCRIAVIALAFML